MLISEMNEQQSISRTVPECGVSARFVRTCPCSLPFECVLDLLWLSHVDNTWLGGRRPLRNLESPNGHQLQNLGKGEEKRQRLAKRPLIFSGGNQIALDRFLYGNDKKGRHNRHSEENTYVSDGDGAN